MLKDNNKISTFNYLLKKKIKLKTYRISENRNDSNSQSMIQNLKHF